ncbi:Uncharacterized protein dnm_029200 [Desulfonema magnum]|uniref:Uncharacterized protein n=2 Tax=Desulfonema magnum TaxID=45655 RepID=A0A975GMP5_9BACT|nr:Uncharacterized protein dnm_029200 [Desulfonema magnum]
MPDAPHSDLFHSEWDMNHPEDPNPPDPLERVPAHPDPPGNFHQSWTPDI